MKTVLQSVFAVVVALAAVGGGQPASAETAANPGKLLSYPLVYRSSGDGSRSAEYTVIFRVRRPFLGRDDVGTSIPGRIAVEDDFDNHDGYQGSLGAGSPSGKCYSWNLPSAPKSSIPKLSGKKIGERVRYEFKLHRTATQTGSATLRRYPRTARLRRDLRAIGCHL